MGAAILSTVKNECGLDKYNMHWLQNHKQYKQEILEMLTFGQKAEIEALYAHGYEFLAKFITKKIVRQDFI